jgi:hypothetical protein
MKPTPKTGKEIPFQLGERNFFLVFQFSRSPFSYIQIFFFSDLFVSANGPIRINIQLIESFKDATNQEEKTVQQSSVQHDVTRPWTHRIWRKEIPKDSPGTYGGGGGLMEPPLCVWTLHFYCFLFSKKKKCKETLLSVKASRTFFPIRHRERERTQKTLWVNIKALPLFFFYRGRRNQRRWFDVNYTRNKLLARSLLHFGSYRIWNRTTPDWLGVKGSI